MRFHSCDTAAAQTRSRALRNVKMKSAISLGRSCHDRHTEHAANSAENDLDMDRRRACRMDGGVAFGGIRPYSAIRAGAAGRIATNPAIAGRNDPKRGST